MSVDPAIIQTGIELDTSDDISADHIITRLADAPRGSVAVVDYLQLLDQRRSNPDLADQVSALLDFVVRTGIIIVLISQVDRRFDAEGRNLPEPSDIRLPNPLDLSLFSKTCFLHDGELRLDGAMAA